MCWCLLSQVLTPDEEPGALTKTRSCDNLTTVTTPPQEVVGNPARRSSDPNIGCGGDTLALLSKEVDSSQGRCSDERSSGDSSDSDATDTSKSEEGEGGEDAETASQLPEEAEEAEEGVLGEKDLQNGQGGGKVCDGDGSYGAKLCGSSESSVEASNHEHSSASQKLVTDATSQVPEGEAVRPVENFSEETFSGPDVNGDNGGGEEKATVMNGHVLAGEVGNTTSVEVDTQTSESSLMNGDTVTATCSAPLDSKMFESSTDTLTGSEDVDQALLLKSRNRLNTEHAISPVVIYQNGDGQDEHWDSDDEGGRLLKGRRDLDAASVESLKLMIQNCSISTSTTDISDSHVSASGNGVAAEVLSRAAGLGLYIRCNNGMCGMGGVGRHTPTSSEASPSVCSLVATPVNSHTPPSTCSPTPGSEGKVCALCFSTPLYGVQL